MQKRDLLEKPYDYLISILLFIHNNNGKTTKSELINKFQISLPTLNDYLSCLQTFFIQNNLVDKVELLFTGDQITLKKAQDFELKQIVLLFLETSTKFQMIQQLAQKGFLSPEYFQLNYAISSATYYRKITELNQLLKKFSLQIKRGRLVGDEKQLRYFFFNFYWFTFEDKLDFEQELANQFIGLIESLEQALQLSFEPMQVLQIKLWMKISFRRMSTESNPMLNPDYDALDRPLFEEVNLALNRYMQTIERPQNIYEAYMFYDFFCSMHNFSPTSSFALRLTEKHRHEHSYLNYMNQTIISYLRTRGYLSEAIPATRITYIESLLYQVHAQLYYFDGFMLPFDNWAIQSIITTHQQPATEKSVHEIMALATKKFDTKHGKTDYQNRFTEIHYTIVLEQIALLNEEKLAIGVFHSLNPFYTELVIQTLTNTLGSHYPVTFVPWKAEQNYDLVLSNCANKSLQEPSTQLYVFSDLVSAYDLGQIEHMLVELMTVH